MATEKKIKSGGINVGVVGATGAVGVEVLKVFEERGFPVALLKVFASPRSCGKKIKFKNQWVEVELLTPKALSELDLVFFDASDAVSREWVPQALAAGCKVIDNSGVYRMDPKVPLVVPEVNGDLLTPDLQLVAGPNCSTVQMTLPLQALHQAFGLRRVVVSTYQSVSGAGQAAIAQLDAEANPSGEKNGSSVFAHPIAYNLIPQIGSLSKQEGFAGFTSEEQKIIEETQKILRLPNLPVMATAVRVPVRRGHSESIMAELERDFESIEQVRAIWSKFEGIIVQDHLEKAVYPMPLGVGVDRDAVLVGRARKDPHFKNTLHFWAVSDNLRKGAALNAVQIAEVWFKLR